MASQLTITCEGKRVRIKASPMAPLHDIMQDACKALGLSHDPRQCQLLVNKRQQDLSIPLRLANIPGGAKLELVTGHEPLLGLPAGSSEPPVRPPATEGQAHGVLAASSFISLPCRTETEISGPQHNVPLSEDLGSCPANGMGNDGNPQAAGPNSKAPDDTAPSSDSSGGHALAGIDRPLHVFLRPEADSSKPNIMPAGEGPPRDDFFEVTREDVQVMMASYQRARGSQGLKTGKMREQEAKEKASRLGPVPIRLQLPDGLTLQGMFGANETIGSIHSFAQACMLPDGPPWHLYIAPPKQIMKDMKSTLLQVGLVPAAIVHVGVSKPEVQGLDSAAEMPGKNSRAADSNLLIRSDILALVGDPPAWIPHPAKPSDPPVRQGSPAADQGKVKLAGDSLSSRTGIDDKAKKGPKWLKLGNR